MSSDLHQVDNIVELRCCNIFSKYNIHKNNNIEDIIMDIFFETQYTHDKYTLMISYTHVILLAQNSRVHQTNKKIQDRFTDRSMHYSTGTNDS